MEFTAGTVINVGILAKYSHKNSTEKEINLLVFASSCINVIFVVLLAKNKTIYIIFLLAFTVRPPDHIVDINKLKILSQ